MQGAVIAPGGIDACVSAANCSVNMDPLHPPNVNCMLLAQLTHKASSLCCVGQSSYGPWHPLGYVSAVAQLQIGLLVLPYRGKSWISTV